MQPVAAMPPPTPPHAPGQPLGLLAERFQPALWRYLRVLGERVTLRVHRTLFGAKR